MRKDHDGCHRCSRIDNVRDLAAWLLQQELQKWNRAALDAAIGASPNADRSSGRALIDATSACNFRRYNPPR